MGFRLRSGTQVVRRDAVLRLELVAQRIANQLIQAIDGCGVARRHGGGEVEAADYESSRTNLGLEQEGLAR